MGELDRAIMSFEAACRLYERGAARPNLALARLDLAAALRARSDPGDSDRAHQLVAEAAAIGAELGLRPVQTPAAQIEAPGQ